VPLVPLHKLARKTPGPSPFSFALAKEVVAGDPLSSCDLYRLALAFNERLPYFDFAWRIAFYMLGLFRSMRNGSADGSLQAPWAEYFFSYQGLEQGQGDWPVAGPGDPEGANLSNPLNMYVWGNAAANMDSEAVRLAQVPMADEFGQPPATVGDLWSLRIAQCGAVEVATGRQNAPAWQAARSWFGTWQGPRSPHGNSWGGFFASPAVIGACQEPDLYDGVPAPWSYEVKFTATTEGIAAGYADKVYPGTCPVGPATTEDYSGHVAQLVRSPWAFYVVLNSGAVEVLPRFAYVEGPYTGEPQLRKSEGRQLDRALQAFTACHRGAAQNDAARSAIEQGAATKVGTWLSGAFVAEDFLCRQYVLAPLSGAWNGSVVAPVIPSGQRIAGADSIILAGNVLSHTVASSCVVNYGYASITGLVAGQSARVSFGAVMKTLTPEAPAVIAPLDVAAGQVIEVKLENDVVVTTPNVDALSAQLTEAVAYKPDLSDLLMVQRLIGDPDTGLNRDCSSWVGDLRARGCVLNSNGNPTVEEPLAAITEHPAFEAIRRWSRYVRMLPANAVRGYAVEGGKSIVWFSRYAAWTGGVPTRTEVIQGTSGIKAGREYAVETTAGGEVYYGPEAKAFVNGEHFVGISGYTDFDINYVGTSKVFELTDGILNPQQAGDLWSGIVGQITTTAPGQGFTNRWLCGFNFKAQHPSDSSEWKPSAYGDIFALNDRATFYAPEIVQEHDKRLLYQVSYGEGVPGPSGGNIISECATGYRYQPVTDVGGNWYWLNNVQVGEAFFPTDYERTCFFKSARIYEPEVEIESAEALTESGTEMVKVTFTGRLHSTVGQRDPDGNLVGAPLTIERDVATWDLDALQAEPYQTTERAIRCHIAQQQTGRNFTATYGDHAAHSSLGYDPAYPYASSWPIAYLVKMLPEPASDTNATQDISDTPVWHDTMIQAETYLRAMCEACVDPDSSVSELQAAIDAAGGDWQAISHWSLHDYSYDRLCQVAFNGAWPGLMPTEATTVTPDDLVRPDNPHGYGPVPQTRVCAQQFNRLVRMVNRLNRFRIMLPYTLERARHYYYGDRLAPECTYPINFPTGNTYGSLQGVTAYPSTTIETSEEDWIESPSAESTRECIMDVIESPPGSGVYAWALTTAAMDDAFRITPTPGIENAMPGYVRDLVHRESIEVIGWSNETKLNYTRTESTSGDPNAWRDPVDGKYYVWLDGPVNENRWFAEFRRVGTVSAPALPAPTDMGFQSDAVGSKASSGGAFTTYAIGFIPGEIMAVVVPVVDVECPDDGGYPMSLPGLPASRAVTIALGPETPSLRLAVLSPCCYVGGAERWVMDLLDVLPRQIQCAGVALMYEETSSTVAIRELRKRAEVVGFGVEPARKLLRKADVCISWGMMPLADCLRDFRGRRIVVIHGSDTGYSSRVVESAVACGAELVGISQATMVPCGSHPARVIRSGVSPERVKCRSGAGQRLRASLGVGLDEMLVGFVGRLSQEKRLPVLIEAIGLLPPRFRALLVGDGFDTAELKRLAAPLERRVLFLPGRLDVASVYDALDYFYCGSPSEGLPYTVLEAALAGIPLISTRVGALLEIAARYGVLWTELPANPTALMVAKASTLAVDHDRTYRLRDVVLEGWTLAEMGRGWTRFLLGSD
jgi:hypothetical protein